MSASAGAAKPRAVGHSRRPTTVTRVRRPSRSQRVLRISTVVVSALALVALFGLVGFHAMLARDQTRIDQLDTRIAELGQDREELRLAIAQLETPERIRAEAIGRLGMMEPESVIYLDAVDPAVLGDAPLTDTVREANG